MDRTSSSMQQDDPYLDLESCLNTSEQDESGDHLSSDNGWKNKLLKKKAIGGHLTVNKSVTPAEYGQGTSETNIELLVDISSDQSPKNRKRTASRKPPRPPKGPTLDFADMKIIREMALAELAMRKRARIERIQELKKSKGAKSSRLSSSSSSLITTLFAMVITLIFALLMFFQGIGSPGLFDYRVLLFKQTKIRVILGGNCPTP